MYTIITLTILSLLSFQNLVSSNHMPYVDVSVNAIWSTGAGRPNPLYSQQVTDFNATGLIFGFLTLAPNNQPCWSANAAMPLNWSLPLAQELKKAGKKVVISFGGAANSDISTKLTVTQLIDAYTNTITMYNADQLDFDLENGLFDNTKINSALQTIQTNYPNVKISFTLPVATTGLTSTGLGIVQSAKNAGINFIVNIMAMDYYMTPAPEMGDAGLQAIASLKSQLATIYPSLSSSQLYAKIAVTPMIGKNDDGTIFTLADTTTISSFAKNNYLAYTSCWSLNNDNPTSSGNPSQTKVGEYTITFVNAPGPSSSSNSTTIGSSTTSGSTTSSPTSTSSTVTSSSTTTAATTTGTTTGTTTTTTTTTTTSSSTSSTPKPTTSTSSTTSSSTSSTSSTSTNDSSHYSNSSTLNIPFYLLSLLVLSCLF